VEGSGGIEAVALRRTYRDVVAVDDVYLRVAPGEAVAIVGPSGAGKSTLLRIFATLVHPDGGHASVAGSDVVCDARRARRALGVVLGDEHTWYWRLSGRGNLAFFAALTGLRKREARDRVATVLDRVGLAGSAADRPVGEWSSGMKARLALARGLLSDPRVLLLDEPTRSLDVGAAEALGQVVGEQRDAGAAVLVATHDLHNAATLADRIMVMAAGRLRTAGSEGEKSVPTEDEVAALVRDAPR